MGWEWKAIAANGNRSHEMSLSVINKNEITFGDLPLRLIQLDI
jgi:hypothetical protein